jgi:L-threonylcarbamoyladenylate synthase
MATRALSRGGVIAYPTEGVFGLGCDLLDPNAVDQIYQLKRRAGNKGLILIADHWRRLEPYIESLEASRMAEIQATWPGPNTWILPARPWVPGWLAGERGTLAVRVTAHRLSARLCAAWGRPLVSTSANISGRAPARSMSQVRLQFGTALDGVLPGPLGGLAGPSAIWDGRTGRRIR